MTDTTTKTKLKEVGIGLVKNGYRIIPIPGGGKWPVMKGWESIHPDEDMVKEWIKSGQGSQGVGILTANTPAVDIDCLDQEVTEAMIAWISEKYNVNPPLRYGKKPKALLLFRSDSAFKKVKSTIWEDDFGDEHALEVLADGQQCVAFGIHPKTNAPYSWPNESPFDIKTSDLPLLTREMAIEIIDKFDEMAIEQGWVKKRAKSINSRAISAIDDDDDWVNDALKPPIDITVKKLQEYLLSIPNDEADYDTWLNIGMALYHQFQGGAEGYDLWVEWSEQAVKFDVRDAKNKWKSFDHHNGSKNPVTARTIINMAAEVARDATEAELLELTQAFLKATTPEEWHEVAHKVTESMMSVNRRRELEPIAMSQYTNVTRNAALTRGVDVNDAKGAKMSLQECRHRLAYCAKEKDQPKWMNDWVYDDSQDVMINLNNKIRVTEKGFNANFDRYIVEMNEMMGTGFRSAFSAATSFYNVPVVNGSRYAPGEGVIFREKNLTFANLYNEKLIPQMPDKLTGRDKVAIKRVRNHIRHLFIDKKDEGFLMDWLAYVVQNPGQRVNYGVVMQGTQGDGKSFFRCLMETVIGMSNVRVLKAKSLEGDFNSWAVGQCVTAVEEIRLSGHNRYETLNSLKDQITNDHIEVHEKGKGQYSAVNTTNYMLFTNFRDALPIDDNDRRYLILQSQWQSRKQLDNFKMANEDYYKDLYGALELSPGGLRKWLMDYEISADFDPKGSAPLTLARELMIKVSMPEFMKDVAECVRDPDYPFVNDDYIVSSELSKYLQSFGDAEEPKTKAKNNMLMRMGYDVSKRIKMRGVSDRVYAKTDSAFVKNNEIDSERIHAHMDNHKEDEMGDFD